MDPGEVPDALKGLYYAEQQLIALIEPVLTVYKIKKGEQLKYSSQVINFPQNVQEVCDVLPRKVSEMCSFFTSTSTRF